MSQRETQAILAFKHIANELLKTSRVLENLGLTKSAKESLMLLDGIIREASDEDKSDYDRRVEKLERTLPEDRPRTSDIHFPSRQREMEESDWKSEKPFRFPFEEPDLSLHRHVTNKHSLRPPEDDFIPDDEEEHEEVDFDSFDDETNYDDIVDPAYSDEDEDD